MRVTIIGGGPAGLAAADELDGLGFEPTLVDEGRALGGQYHRGTPQSAPGNVMLESIAFDATGDAVRVARGDAVFDLPRPLIVATGATELVVPVPGWTLPGVTTCGGAQALAKEHGVAIGRRVVVAGSGPFLLPVASELLRHGARIVAVIEASRPAPRLAAALVRDSKRLREGAGYLRTLIGRVPLLTRHGVVEIRGDGTVEEVVVARLTADGRVRPGTERRFACDAVCLSDGFTPATELAELAGPSDVFAAGACVEPYGGAQLAAVSGALAAYALAGRVAPSTLLDAGNRHRRFAAALRATFPTRVAWYCRTTDATTVCRCEDVTAAEIRSAVLDGAPDVNVVKHWTRAGMGLCQGRTCGPTLMALAGRGHLRARPPLRPLPLPLLLAAPMSSGGDIPDL